MALGKTMRTAAFLLACGATALAQADTVKLSGFLGKHAAVDIDSPNNINASAGEFAGLWNGNSFSAMCVDVLHTIDFTTTYTNYTAKTPAAYGFSPAQMGLFNKLYTNYYGVSQDSSANAAAFQIAVWEITYDGNGALDIDANYFDVGTDGNASAKTTASGWLSTLGTLSTGAWSFTVLDSVDVDGNATQDLLVAIPVPEPGAWALLLAGFGVLLVSGRRRLALSR